MIEFKKVNPNINARYYLDGLIYTPANLPVGYTKNKYNYNLKQGTGWNLNLKWKPPHDNTIDFLVKFDKEVIANRGNVKVTRNKIIKKAFMKLGETSYKEYISAKLYNGGTRSSITNPCNIKQYKTESIFEPILFEPSNPSEENICNILIPVSDIRKGYSIKKVPIDIEGNIIDDNTIVEVSYNNFIMGEQNYEQTPSLRWKILRTRHDKTFNYKSGLNEQKRLFLQIKRCIDIVNKYDISSQLKLHEQKHLEKNINRIKYDLKIKKKMSDFDTIKNNKNSIESYYSNKAVFKVSINYGNHVSVAHNIWKTIHNPITIDMITTGVNIPTITDEEEKYYKREQKRDKSITLNLQNFHNKVIKNRILIQNAVTYLKNNNETDISLLDLACGKGGDIPKWRDNNIKTVVGIDCVHNNIDDTKDGACSRYNFYRKQSENNDTKIPNIYFLVGESSKSIISGECVTDSRYSSMQYDLWNTDVYPNTNFINNKFNIVSVMFAAHYFFKSEKMLDTFINNINDNIKPGGLLIGCCFDGKSIFDKLKDIPYNGYIEGIQNGQPIWRIKNKYTNIDFNNDGSSIGLSINVLIYSIGQIIEEYLVNYDLLKSKLAQYGIEPLTSDELTKIDWLPSTGSVSSFKNVFEEIRGLPNDNPLHKLTNNLLLTSEEKGLSYLFKYFIFKKKSIEENSLSDLEQQIYTTKRLRRLLSVPLQKKLKLLLMTENKYSEKTIDTAIVNMFKKYSEEIALQKQMDEKEEVLEDDPVKPKLKSKIKVRKGKSIASSVSLKSQKSKKTIQIKINPQIKRLKKLVSQLESIKDNPEEYEQAKEFIIRNINEYKSNNPDASAVMDSLLKKI